MINNRIVIYTALFGEYDNLQKPLFFDKNIDFICFTNNFDLKSKYWKIVYLENLFENKKMNRYVKFHPHKYLYNYNTSIYIDSNVQIYSSILKKINFNIANNLISIPQHPFRKNISEEINFCIENKLIDKNIMTNDKIEKNFDIVNNKYTLTANRVLIRKHNDARCIQLMSIWWEYYLSGITRDQISLPFALNEIKFFTHIIKSKYSFLDFFIVWPHLNEKKINKIKFYTKMFIFILLLNFIGLFYDHKR